MKSHQYKTNLWMKSITKILKEQEKKVKSMSSEFRAFFKKILSYKPKKKT